MLHCTWADLWSQRGSRARQSAPFAGTTGRVAQKRPERFRGTAIRSEAGRVLQLVVPVEAHLLDHAIAHDDDAGVLGREVLVVGERRDVDVVAALPLEL